MNYCYHEFSFFLSHFFRLSSLCIHKRFFSFLDEMTIIINSRDGALAKTRDTKLSCLHRWLMCTYFSIHKSREKHSLDVAKHPIPLSRLPISNNVSSPIFFFLQTRRYENSFLLLLDRGFLVFLFIYFRFVLHTQCILSLCKEKERRREGESRKDEDEDEEYKRRKWRESGPHGTWHRTDVSIDIYLYRR